MGYNNPPMSWSELERKLSGRKPPRMDGDGGDAPGWSRKRPAYDPVQRPQAPADAVPYAELHCHSNFSFLDGASDPEALVEESVRLGLHGLAITDHDGFYGVVRFADAAQDYDLRTVYGAELSLGLTAPQNGIPDPEGSHLLVLARGVAGYHRLAGAITEAQLGGGEKGRPEYDLEQLAAMSGDWFILTGCRKGLVRQALANGGAETARAELDRLVSLFGRDQIAVEVFDHGMPTDSRDNEAMAALAADAGLPVIASNNAHFASPAERRLAAAVSAVRARRSLADMNGWMPTSGAAHLRSGAEMVQRFARFPGAVERTVHIADELAFELRAAAPKLPDQRVPDGHTAMSWLRELVAEGATRLYPGADAHVHDRLQRELAVIQSKGFAGYFLIVHDLVHFAKGRGILCQGRGSAANSAVCFALGITAVDSIRYDLPFERFLSSTRDEEPDIDVDFDSDRREEVIQYVYQRYGRRNAAQVANVITYRPKSAVRDMAKALGYSTGQQDAWSKQIDSWSSISTDGDHDVPGPVVELAQQLLKAPRHLGIHSGGMVLTDRPVGEVCPIEHGRMDNRTVLQWDKDDCASMGLVKFDLLGLGMLGAIAHTFDLVKVHTGEEWRLETIPAEEQGVYDMLCRADSIGVFQVESRAQMGTLPRLKPRCFYDLVIEIALIRPGPIQGGAVHPYIRRATGKEAVTYQHPVLEPVLKRTLGIPLFQEQLMQIAMAIGGCTGDDADLLRRAMGSKRGIERIGKLRDKLYEGMREHGITGDLADEIYEKIEAFANFGFAESHSISFALLVYASSWLKLHYPGAFLAALLRSQPMGFYSPQSLVGDARRHGVKVLKPDIRASGVHADLEMLSGVEPVGNEACLPKEQPPVGPFDPGQPMGEHRRDGHFAVRLGLSSVQAIGKPLAERIVVERESVGPFADMADVARRVGLNAKQVEALATAGAFGCFGISRRQALWNAVYTAGERPDQLAGTSVALPAPMLPGMSPTELTLADLWATRISPSDHPVGHLREALEGLEIVAIDRLYTIESGRRIKVAGLVTHRQRPSTAGGVTFLSLEDEGGMLNVICTVGLWQRYRRVGRESAGLVIRGILERSEGVTNLLADRLEPLDGVLMASGAGPEAAAAIPPRHSARNYR